MNSTTVFSCVLAAALLAQSVAGCRAQARSTRRTQSDLQEIGYHENAGEGDLSVSLRIRPDSTFYRYFNLNKNRCWSGPTNPARWQRLVQAVNSSDLAHLQRLSRRPGYDGHSASVYLQQSTGTCQLSFDLLQNGRKVNADTFYRLLQTELSESDRLSLRKAP